MLLAFIQHAVGTEKEKKTNISNNINKLSIACSFEQQFAPFP